MKLRTLNRILHLRVKFWRQQRQTALLEIPELKLGPHTTKYFYVVTNQVEASLLRQYFEIHLYRFLICFTRFAVSNDTKTNCLLRNIHKIKQKNETTYVHPVTIIFTMATKIPYCNLHFRTDRRGETMIEHTEESLKNMYLLLISETVTGFHSSRSTVSSKWSEYLYCI